MTDLRAILGRVIERTPPGDLPALIGLLAEVQARAQARLLAPPPPGVTLAATLPADLVATLLDRLGPDLERELAEKLRRRTNRPALEAAEEEETTR